VTISLTARIKRSTAGGFEQVKEEFYYDMAVTEKTAPPRNSLSPPAGATTSAHFQPAAASAHRRQAASRLLRCASPASR
jgi:hypothetical protein